MTIAPRFNFPPGTEITLLNRPMAVTGITDNGYSMVGLDDGIATVVSFDRLVEHLKLPGGKINSEQAASGGHLTQRLDGYFSVQSLKNEKQQALGRLHLAMCEAVDIYVAKCRQNDPGFTPSGRKLDTDAARKFIAEQTTLLLGERVFIKPPRGGEQVKGHVLYRGRTINDYYQIYIDLDPRDRCAKALITLQHLRGNRTSRLPVELRNLMTEAWEKVGLDKKAPSNTNVHNYLEISVKALNKSRELNDLPSLIVPSKKTLRKHRDALLTPTEYAIAVEGPRETKRKKGRGSTDFRALMIGELCGMDEQKMSMVTSAKEEGFWHTLSDDAKCAYEAADKYIRKRLHIIVMFDVACRMPLAWIITENPNADATLALLRMATRDKTREQIRYGCTREAAKGCGLLHLRNDNGVGLRNRATISALMGLGTFNGITRTYSPTDRAHDERFFGTIESNFFKLMPGYTGRRPGDVPGYDAIRNGVVDVEMLYGMLTRYLVDEYPFQTHYGAGIFGRRPWDVYQEINETRGQIAAVDPHTRRIHLGWEACATPSDEGVRVFQGIWFNSDELQAAREEQFFEGKVKVFVDPDNLNIATVLMPGFRDPIEVILQTSAFADMTLGEVLQLVAEYRREDPEVTELYDDRLLEARSRRYNDISTISVEHDLPRSYTSIEECKTLAKAAFAGARTIRTQRLAGTARLDAVTKIDQNEGIIPLGGGPSVIDGTVDAPPETPSIDSVEHNNPQILASETSEAYAVEDISSPKRSVSRAPKGKSMKTARPTNLKELK
ncbi:MULTISPECIES: DDE-type integrase/transposase/recombinase [Pacificibacter]|uniref:DDE-type integrase/transposase/recombinase n=1 Tax=Pacificibacter TaxID=1042323 RepID=UPI001C09737B|nr:MULTISPECIES: DDE-type integrase/transposase/recombinase [Pacificibacter]MBU2936462.1 DDE-type integrase/transposase/recombinase [Pacificibacter marinus]MDO6614736.1 DDE-type integrase/transposase/recombinase [Pacificibacter sp. 1_MG-2023]